MFGFFFSGGGGSAMTEALAFLLVVRCVYSLNWGVSGSKICALEVLLCCAERVGLWTFPFVLLLLRVIRTAAHGNGTVSEALAFAYSMADTAPVGISLSYGSKGNGNRVSAPRQPFYTPCWCGGNWVWGE